VLESGEGTTSGAADQARPVVTWEIAPLRAAALRTERAVNQRWQTLRAAIIGGALLLGVIGSAAALSLTGSSLPGGMGFLSADAASSSDVVLTAGETRDGVADRGDPAPPTATAPPAEDDVVSSAGSNSSTSTDQAPTQPEPARGTPTADPQPEPEPVVEPAPAPDPTPTEPPVAAADEDEDQGLIGDLLDLLLPGLLP